MSRFFLFEPFAMSFFFRKREAVGSGTERKSSAKEASTGFTNTVDDSCLHFSHSKVTPLHRCFRNTQFSPAALSQAALSSGIGLFTNDRISSFRCSLMRPTAIASITQSATPTRTFIFFCPRMKCFSNPKLTSNRELTRSTAVRFLYSRPHFRCSSNLRITVSSGR